MHKGDSGTATHFFLCVRSCNVHRSRYFLLIEVFKSLKTQRPDTKVCILRQH